MTRHLLGGSENAFIPCIQREGAWCYAVAELALVIWQSI
jgi:hypothetical protein